MCQQLDKYGKGVVFICVVPQGHYLLTQPLYKRGVGYIVHLLSDNATNRRPESIRSLPARELLLIGVIILVHIFLWCLGRNRRVFNFRNRIGF